MTVTFEYNGNTYPSVMERDEGWEQLLVMIPEPTGDYFLAKIDSFGKYELIEEVSAANVSVILPKPTERVVNNA